MHTQMAPEPGAGVVVTGAARGIGREVVRGLSGLGWRVVGVDLDEEGPAETMASLPGRRHDAIVGDAADETVVSRACGAAGAGPGGLRGFVANAGFARPGLSSEYSIEDWELTLRVNLTAPFVGARVARRHMDGGGSIAIISSVNGTVGMGGRAAYCAAKAGVNDLVRALAVEWGADRVRVNAVAPGTIVTDMARELVAAGHTTFEGMASRVPMARSGEPEDVAGAVAYLLSDASAYVTGVVLPVDGGWAVNGAPTQNHDVRRLPARVP